MSTLTSQALGKEVKEIIGKSKHFIMPDYEFIIHTKEKDITIPHLLNIEVERNYSENVSDIIYVEFLIGLGFATKTLFENRDALEATIKLKYSNKKIFKRRFKLILITKLEDIYDSKVSKASENTLDKQDFATIRAQCVDDMVLILKNKYISGIFHNCDLKTLIKGIIAKQFKELNVDANVNIYDLDNKTKYENIIIDPFTKFVKLPYILQNTHYGLYKYGVNIYFTNLSETNKIKYDVDIFPVFDYTRYKKESKRSKLLLISPEDSNLSKNDFNFYYKNGIYKTLVNNLEFKIEGEDRRYKIGNGMIMEYSHNTINRDLVTVTNDKVTFDETSAYDIVKVDKTRSISNLIETNGDDNIYKYDSVLNRLQGIIGSVMLPKVNPEVIYPGMPLKYIFINDGKLHFTTGIVQGVHFTYDFINQTSVATLVAIFKRITKEK